MTIDTSFAGEVDLCRTIKATGRNVVAPAGATARRRRKRDERRRPTQRAASPAGGGVASSARPRRLSYRAGPGRRRRPGVSELERRVRTGGLLAEGRPWSCCIPVGVTRPACSTWRSRSPAATRSRRFMSTTDCGRPRIRTSATAALTAAGLGIELDRPPARGSSPADRQSPSVGARRALRGGRPVGPRA